jgi:hypothetical protein
MPREQLLGLAADVDRLLDAGATAAPGSESLARRSRALRDLGQKVAALNPVADAVDKLTRSAGKQSGPAFLDLVAMTRQVRASLAGTGPEGDLKPAAPSGPWRTALFVRDFNPIHEAFAKSGGGDREETVRSAVARGGLDDLRLLSAMMDCLGTSATFIADQAAEHGLPAFGPAVLPDLHATLDMKGRVADGRRLEAICRIDRKAGVTLCRRCIKEAGPSLRATAVRWLADLAPAAEVEKAALECAADKNREVREAAMRALRVGTSDATLEVLVKGLLDVAEEIYYDPDDEFEDEDGEEYHDRPTAWQSLQVLAHRGTTARLLREAVERLAVVTAPPPKPAGKRGPTKEEKQKAEATRAEAAEHVCALIRVASLRKNGDRAAVARTALEILREVPKEVDVKTAAIEALGAVGPATSEVFPALLDALKGKTPALARYALCGLRRLDPAARRPLVPAVLELAQTEKKDAGVRRAAMILLTGHLDTHRAAVLKLFRAGLKEKNQSVLSPTCDAVAKAGPAAAEMLPDVLDVLRRGTLRWYSFDDLFTRVDPEGKTTVPAMIELLKVKSGAVRQEAVGILEAYGPKAKAAIPAMGELMHGKDPYLANRAEWAIKAIEG